MIRLGVVAVIGALVAWAQTAGSEDLPDAPGKAVVLKVCTRCHGTGAFAQIRMTRAEWQAEVNGMVARGATGTRKELRTVVDYLAKNLGPGKSGGGRSRGLTGRGD